MKEGQYVIVKQGYCFNKNSLPKPCIVPDYKRVYTVRDIVGQNGRFGIRLVEIVNPIVNLFTLIEEPSFDMDYFEVVPAMNINLEEIMLQTN